jgi:hypothetical protein
LDQYLRNSTDEATYAIWKEFSDYWIGKFQGNEDGQLEATPSAVSGWFEGYSAVSGWFEGYSQYFRILF